MGHRAQGARHKGTASLSVISYSLFGRYLAMKCLDDFYGFYDFYDFNGFNDFNDLTNSLIDK